MLEFDERRGPSSEPGGLICPPVSSLGDLTPSQVNVRFPDAKSMAASPRPAPFQPLDWHLSLAGFNAEKFDANYLNRGG